MKFLKLLTFIFSIILLANFSSAAIVTYAEWDDYSSSLSIQEGQSAGFEANFVGNPSLSTIGAKLYDNSYNELHTFASESVSGSFYNQVFTITPAMYGSVGNFEVEVIGSDFYGNIASHSIYLTVTAIPTPIDTTAPVITLLGANPQLIQLGDSYTELGATALDDTDGDLTSSIVIDSSLVNTASVGIYTVIYSVQDTAGNPATEFRLVNVTVPLPPIDTIAPVITLLGANPQVIQLGDPYTELGATALDDIDGNLTPSIVIDSSLVNTSLEGIYNVTYNVNDSSGNSAIEVVRLVNVTAAPIPPIDDEAPIITVISPKDRTYRTDIILFKVEVNEDALVQYSLDGGSNITMYETSTLTFEHERRLDYEEYEVTFYATDPSGNIGTETISFKLKRKSSNNDDNNETEPINYFAPAIRNNTAEAITLPSTKKGISLGYLLISFLIIGIMIILLLIVLIKRAKEEEKVKTKEDYSEIFEN